VKRRVSIQLEENERTIMSDTTHELTILVVTENGVRCSVAEGEPFWLPKNSVQWRQPLKTGQKVSATIPEWLAEKHRQLVGDEKFEEAKRRKEIDVAREAAKPLGLIPNARDMSGVLFRNQRKNTDNQPDYFGDAIIRGEKFRLAGWLREGKGGKFLRLAVSDEKSA
jgi:hypothetical protein